LLHPVGVRNDKGGFAMTRGKCKDAKKSGVSPSTREGSGKWLCLGLNS
jgi:hypothetical protein